MDINAIRRRNLRAWVAQHGTPAKERSYFSQLLGGATFGERAARRIEASYGMPAAWLDRPRIEASEGNVSLADRSGVRSVPVISWVQAGNWAKVMDVAHPAGADEWIVVPPDGGPRCFGLTVRGESMRNPDGEPTFSEGDRIVVDPDREALHKSLVIVALDAENEATFKQLIKEDGRSYLKALNPAWPNRIVEVGGTATICGVVIGKHVRYV